MARRSPGLFSLAIILIIFIVLTPVVSGAVLLPRAQHGRRAEDRPFALVLGQSEGRPFVSLDDERAERLALEPNALARLHGPLGKALDRGDRLHLKVDRGLSYGPLNTLLTFCRAAGA